MKKSSKKARKRGLVIVVGSVFLSVWLGALLFTVKETFFSGRSSAMAQSHTAEPVPPASLSEARYKILDRRHEDLAVSFRMYSVYARPLEIKDTDMCVEFLSRILKLDKKNLLRDLRAERSFVWLGRHLSEGKAQEIRGKGLSGVYITSESQRYYPFHQTASHVVGFLKDGHGLAGVESYYDRMLKVSGEEGVSPGTVDIQGHVVLSLDIRMQELLERKIGILSAEMDAASAVGIIMRPSTGAILAMSSLPTYDPNLFWDFGAEERRNMVVSEVLNIGGLDRIFRLAAFYEAEGRRLKAEDIAAGSIEALKRSLQSEFLPRSDNKKLDYFSEGEGQKVSTELHWREDFKLSAAQSMKFKEYVGLTDESVIDLPVINSFNSTSTEGSGFDQSHFMERGRKATAVNLAVAFSRLINDGNPVRPHLATGILGPSSGKTAKFRHEKSAVILPDTARKLRKFLTGFAQGENGPVFMESFVKTGNKPSEVKNVEPDISTTKGGAISQADLPKYQSLLIGFTPAEKPELVMLISFNDIMVDLDKKSPIRAMAEKNFRRFLELAEEDVRTVKKERDQSIYAKTYQQWFQSQWGQGQSAENDGDTDRVLMPDLKGVSLRKALQTIQPLGLKIKVIGSGTVVSQSPGRGKKINSDLCVIELKEDRA